MFLKRRTQRKDCKEHVYYSVCESLRMHGGRTMQRQLLHLGELNTTQHDAWQHTLDVPHEDGSRHQRRLFADGENGAPPAGDDVVKVKLSTFAVKQPRRFGDCWVGCHAGEQLGLRTFWQEQLGESAGEVPWAKVLELLAVNRHLAPRSELYVHEKWFAQTALDVLLDTDAAVAGKDRLYRCLDRIVAHKPALEKHLAQKWRELFGATFDVLLSDSGAGAGDGGRPQVIQENADALASEILADVGGVPPPRDPDRKTVVGARLVRARGRGQATPLPRRGVRAPLPHSEFVRERSHGPALTAPARCQIDPRCAPVCRWQSGPQPPSRSRQSCRSRPSASR
jgi:hypothetical protein